LLPGKQKGPLPVLIGCSVHGVRDSRKYASLYSRWPTGEGTEWVRVRQKLCAAAYTELTDHFRGNSDYQSSSNVSACCMCGAEISANLNGTYVTAFVPGREQTEFALPTCDSCTKQLREFLQVGAEPLPDRGGVVGASGPNTPNPWDDVQ